MIARATTSDQWEPFATWARFVETTDRLLGAGDLALAREGGRWAALEDLRRLYPDLARQGTPRDLLELASTFWRWYYDGGRAEAVAADEEEAALFEVIDFPAPNAAHCNRVLGWIGGAFAYIGVDVSIDMPMCRALGDERCLYVMRGEALRRFVTDPPI